MVVQRFRVAGGQELREIMASLASASCGQQSALPGPLSPLVEDERRIGHLSEHASDPFALGESLRHCLHLRG
eukprot:563506-Alexandrium_andersonii.AAC.1